MKTWEEIRDEVAGMLADGESLESIIGKLEEMKNEMAKAELIAVFDELKKPKPLTNEEWLCGLSTEEKAHELYRRCNYASIFGSPTAEEFEKWLKEVHKE